MAESDKQTWFWDQLNQNIDKLIADSRLDYMILHPPVLLTVTDATDDTHINTTDGNAAIVHVAGSVQDDPQDPTFQRTFAAILPIALVLDERFVQLLGAYNPSSALFAADDKAAVDEFMADDSNMYVIEAPPAILGGPMFVAIEDCRELATAIANEIYATHDQEHQPDVTEDDYRHSVLFLVLHLAQAYNTTYGPGLAGQLMKNILMSRLITVNPTHGTINAKRSTGDSIYVTIKSLIQASPLRANTFKLNLYRYVSAQIAAAGASPSRLSLDRDLAYVIGLTDDDLIQNWEQYQQVVNDTITLAQQVGTTGSQWPDMTPTEEFARSKEDPTKVNDDIVALYTTTPAFTAFVSTNSIPPSVPEEHEAEKVRTIVPPVPTELPQIVPCGEFVDVDTRDVHLGIPWLKDSAESVDDAVARMAAEQFLDSYGNIDATYARSQHITVTIDKTTDPDHPRLSLFKIDPSVAPTDAISQAFWAHAATLVEAAIADQPYYSDPYTTSHDCLKQLLPADLHIPTPSNLFYMFIPRGTAVYIGLDENRHPTGIICPKFADIFSAAVYMPSDFDYTESLKATMTPLVFGHVVYVKYNTNTISLRPNQYQPRLGKFIEDYGKQLGHDNEVIAQDPAGTKGTQSDGAGVSSGWDLWLIIALIVYVISAINDSERGETLALLILIARFMGVLKKWSFSLP